MKLFAFLLVGCASATDPQPFCSNTVNDYLVTVATEAEVRDESVSRPMGNGCLLIDVTQYRLAGDDTGYGTTGGSQSQFSKCALADCNDNSKDKASNPANSQSSR